MSRRVVRRGRVAACLLALLVPLAPLTGCTGSGDSSGSGSQHEDMAAAPGAGIDRMPRSPAPVTSPPRSDLVIWAPPDIAPALRPLTKKCGTVSGHSVRVESVSDVRSALEDVTGDEAGPDVFLGPHTWLGELEQQHAVSPVSISADQQDRLAPKALAAARYQGRLWGVPYAVANLALVRNTHLAPKPPETFASLVATGKQLKREGAVDRILLQTVGSTGDVYSGYPYLSAYGGGIFGKTPNGEYSPERLIIDSDASVRGARQLAQLAREGVVKADVDNTNAVPLFGDGRAPYLITGAWSMRVIKDSGIPYAISPLPSLPDGGQPRPLLDVDLFYVSATAASPQLAKEFVRDCATRQDVQVRLARASGLPPALTAAYHTVAAEDPDYAAWFTAGQDGDPVPALPQMRAVWGPLGQAFADIVAGQDPDKRLHAAAREIASDL